MEEGQSAWHILVIGLGRNLRKQFGADLGTLMQNTNVSIDDLRVMVQALGNWSEENCPDQAILLEAELRAVIDYAIPMLGNDVMTQNEFSIARSLLVMKQIVPALQRLERAILRDKLMIEPAGIAVGGKYLR